MNLTSQLCALTVILIVLYFYSRDKKIQVRTQKVFFVLWMVSSFTIVSDIISVLFITHQDMFPYSLAVGVSKFYLATIISEATVAIVYIWSDILDNAGIKSVVYRNAFVLVGVVSCIITLTLPLHIHYEGALDLYTYGPAAYFTYIVGVSLVISLVVSIVKRRDQILPSRRYVMIMWIAVRIVSSVIQFFFPAVLVESFASAIAVLLIFVKLENPGSYIDRETGLFNQSAFIQFIKHKLTTGNSFAVVGLTYTLGIGENVSVEVEEEIRREIVTFISKLNGTVVFRIGVKNDIAFYFEDKEMAERAYTIMSVRFENTWGEENIRRVIPYWYMVSDSTIVKNAEDYVSLFQQMEEKRDESIGNNYVDVDEYIMRELYVDEDVERLILSAIKNDRVEVFFQPIYSTKDYRFESAEALVRIRDEKDNFVPPMEFIGVAEKTGLIVKLGEIVFEKVCQFLKNEEPIKYGLKYIEVNLSLIQCGYEGLADSFIDIMEKYDVDPALINLEITETASLVERQALLQNMEILRDFGISFSLDDFGTGHSNLNYIVDMPVDIVKFDRVMIQSYFTSTKAKYVMDAAMHMVHGMGLNIVAEGVEEEEQLSAMEKLGIAYIQGFYFSKPLPQANFLEFIKKENK